MQTVAIVLLVVAVLSVLIRRFAGVKNEHVKNVSADEANEFMKQNKNAFILDVRTRGEYKSGHLPGAKNVPVDELPSRIGEIEKYKNNPVIVYCASGGRSPSAVRTLLKSDFNNIIHMNRGISSWSYKIERK